MAAEADAAAHDETLHERNNRLGVLGDLDIQAIFVAPEVARRLQRAGLCLMVDAGNVAAGAEGLFAPPLP